MPFVHVQDFWFFLMSCMWIPTSKLHKYSVCEAISEQMMTVLSLKFVKVRLVMLGSILGLCTYDRVISMYPIKLKHVQLLGRPTGALALVGMLIGDN